MSTEARLIWDARCLLGEGPAWFPAEQALRFVDIKAGRLHRYVPGSDACEILVVGGMPSFLLPEQGGGLLVGSNNRIRRIEGGALGPVVAEIAMPGHNRTNDATVDPAGRIWFGTMDDEEAQATGGSIAWTRPGCMRWAGRQSSPMAPQSRQTGAHCTTSIPAIGASGA